MNDSFGTAAEAQRAAALKRANDVRIGNAVAKRKIATGELRIVELLTRRRGAADDLRVGELLTAVPGIGETKARRVALHAQIPLENKLRDVSLRRRQKLLDAIRRQAPAVGRSLEAGDA